MLTMCNYYGMCDEHGRCVGHSIKVTEEYGKILRDMGEDISLVCSPCIERGLALSKNKTDVEQIFSQVIRLPYDISIVGNSIVKRISDKLKIFSNIRIALKNKGTIFFYQVDFFFFLYIMLFYKQCTDRKIVILIFHQDFTGGRLSGILKKIYEKALHKIDSVIYTQKGAEIPHDNSGWMPDFIYRFDEYQKYRNIPKSGRVVCLGTMNRYKQIEELVEVWRAYSTELPELLIAGRFDDNNRYSALCENLPYKVSIRNEVLSYEEYMMLLSESSYSILPYDMEQYKNRTSGVLLESIYCGVIPVAPDMLLKQNMLPGIGYKSLTEIVEQLQSDTKPVSDMFSDIYEEYGLEHAIAVLKDMLIA